MSVNGRLLANRTGCLSWCSVSFLRHQFFFFLGFVGPFSRNEGHHSRKKKKEKSESVCVYVVVWVVVHSGGTASRILVSLAHSLVSYSLRYSGRVPSSFLFFVFFYFDVVPSSPGDTELHSIRKRWTWTQKSLSDVTSLTGQSFFSTLSRMFCILFCYWVDHRRLLFPSVCRSTERPRRLLFRPQNCRISQSLSTVCVCVFCLCVGLRRVRGYISIYFQTILLPSFLLLLWVASLFIFVK